jgi:hypothetical protein
MPRSILAEDSGHYTYERAASSHEMASNNCDAVRYSLRIWRRRRIAKHKDQKDFRAIAYTNSQTPKEETDGNSIARHFTETKESFSGSIVNGDAKRQIKAKEGESDPNARARRESIRDSVGNARALWRRTCSRRESLAERESVAWSDSRVRE